MISDMALLHPETQITLCINYCYHKFSSRTYWENLCRARAGKLIMNLVIMEIYPENLDGGLDPHLDLLNLILFIPALYFLQS